DGRSFLGTFTTGAKSGVGVFQWPNGNRYTGGFSADERSGLGIFYWRDGTIYQGQFANNRMQGYGVKRQPDGTKELQHWHEGALVLARPLVEEQRCKLAVQERDWMFDGPECVNGLAHGQGLAVSLDGELVIVDGQFVLGKLVRGEVQDLKPGES
ncbi:MAG: hypothetical protein IH908_02135, partial [Proteobacteria bacterium]|nr:hypothetical protein [Pseudomonadota bacterium]